MPDLNWQDLRYVLAVARAGALAAAARGLRVDETTVARRIARAEAALGARLFDRIKGALTPTEAGQAVIAQAERVEATVDALTASAAGADAAVAGTVRLTTIPLLLNRLLAPALDRLLRAHPALRVELVAEPRNLSLTKRDADIALRLARPAREPAVIARRIGTLPYAVFAPARRAARALPWIAYEDAMAGLPHARWIAAAIRHARAGRPRLVVNDAETALHAIKAGLGRSLLPCAIGDREPGLKRQPGPPVLSRELWLLVHPDLRHLARIRAVVAWLEATVAAGDR